MTFSGRTAVVTGGTGALGSACVRSLLESGVNVAVPYKSDRGSELLPKSTSGASVIGIKSDLTSESDVSMMAKHVVESFGSIDYLINAAGGYLGGKTIDEVTLGEWEGILRLNLWSTFLTCRVALQNMRLRRFGRIINIAAMPAIHPSARKGPYALSKRGVITLTETIAEETKGTDITANAIAPSTIRTEENRQSMPDADFSAWVTPEEIAGLATYLCSDEAGSVRGNVIKIFGRAYGG
jgi:NAD(P)-dependent dehydrogenase (short-subunit alcohol dehydrogenase family)